MESAALDADVLELSLGEPEAFELIFDRHLNSREKSARASTSTLSQLLRRHRINHVIVVTGPGSIGQAIARRVGAGKHVVLADLREDKADGAAAVMRDAGFDVSTHNRRCVVARLGACSRRDRLSAR